MLSSQDVDEISSFDANGDSELSVHEFAKACLSLSDEEAAQLGEMSRRISQRIDPAEVWAPAP